MRTNLLPVGRIWRATPNVEQSVFSSADERPLGSGDWKNNVRMATLKHGKAGQNVGNTILYGALQ